MCVCVCVFVSDVLGRGMCVSAPVHIIHNSVSVLSKMAASGVSLD